MGKPKIRPIIFNKGDDYRTVEQSEQPQTHLTVIKLPHSFPSTPKHEITPIDRALRGEIQPVLTSDNWEIKELEDFFNSVPLPAVPFKLNNYSTIIDVRKYISSELNIVKGNIGKRWAFANLERLREMKQYLLK